MTVRLMDSIEIASNERGRFEVVAGDTLLFDCDTFAEALTVSRALELIPLTMGAANFMVGAAAAIRRRQLASREPELEKGSKSPVLENQTSFYTGDEEKRFPPCSSCQSAEGWRFVMRESYEDGDQATGKPFGADLYKCVGCENGILKIHFARPDFQS